jgi:transcriptional regulatory protein LevR
MKFNNKIEETSGKITVISNINTMRRIIGVSELDLNHNLKRSYDDLFEEQNNTIEHYNQALNNKNNGILQN